MSQDEIILLSVPAGAHSVNLQLLNSPDRGETADALGTMPFHQSIQVKNYPGNAQFWRVNQKPIYLKSPARRLLLQL